MCTKLAVCFCCRGVSEDQGFAGDDGTVTGKDCPKGLYGTFCKVICLLSDVLPYLTVPYCVILLHM
jgi:hypothetical protein